MKSLVTWIALFENGLVLVRRAAIDASDYVVWFEGDAVENCGRGIKMGSKRSMRWPRGGMATCTVTDRLHDATGNMIEKGEANA